MKSFKEILKFLITVRKHLINKNFDNLCSTPSRY